MRGKALYKTILAPVHFPSFLVGGLIGATCYHAICIAHPGPELPDKLMPHNLCELSSNLYTTCATWPGPAVSITKLTSAACYHTILQFGQAFPGERENRDPL